MQGNVLGDSHDQRHFGFDGLLDRGYGLMGGDIDGCCVRL
jgi:hypothetical protein